MKKVGVIVVLVIIVAGGIYLFIASGGIPTSLNKKTQTASLGEQIYTKTQNPLEDKLPETNPFAAETNPAKKVFPNPFNRL